MDTVIRFDKVRKGYNRNAGQLSLRELLSNIGRRSVSNGHGYFWALQDVSFQIGQGEAVGIIGSNGAGKTTTLKLLSNITRPTSGHITCKGRTSALIELGAGFHPELTGRENVYLNGIILGMSRREIARRFDEIVAFAEVGPFIDMPVKRYSSGMYARLGFAVAAHVEPDVLLLDEVLSVGDMAFQAKCFERMGQLLARGTSLVFVSHNFGAIQRVCSRVLVLHRGTLAFDGPAAEGIASYATILRSTASPADKPSGPERGGLAERRMTHGARIQRVSLVGQDDGAIVVKSGEQIRVRVETEFFEDAHAPVFAFTVRSENGDIVYDTTTRLLKAAVPDFRAGQRTTLTCTLNANLLAGTYSLTTDVAYADLSCYYDYVADALIFTVPDQFTARGIANLDARIEISAN